MPLANETREVCGNRNLSEQTKLSKYKHQNTYTRGWHAGKQVPIIRPNTNWSFRFGFLRIQRVSRTRKIFCLLPRSCLPCTLHCSCLCRSALPRTCPLCFPRPVGTFLLSLVTSSTVKKKKYFLVFWDKLIRPSRGGMQFTAA